MTFTALTGALSHFAIGGGITDWSILVMCILSTLLFAMATAKFANKASAKVMNRMLGFWPAGFEHCHDYSQLHYLTEVSR